MDGTVTLANVGSAKEQPVVVADDISRIQFTLENRTGGTHETGFRIAGLPAGEDAVTLGSRTAATIPGGSQEAQRVILPVGAASTAQATITATCR